MDILSTGGLVAAALGLLLLGGVVWTVRTIPGLGRTAPVPGSTTGAAQHLFVTMAFFPLSLILCVLLAHASQQLVQYLRANAEVFGSEGIVVRLASTARFTSLIGVPNAMDVLTMVFFWQCVYLSTTVLHRVIDIQRVLKVSRRRLFAFRQQPGSHSPAAAGTSSKNH